MYCTAMKGYLRAHVEKFKYQSINTQQWKEFFLEHFKKQVWLIVCIVH